MPNEPRIAIVHEYLTRLGGAERVVKTLADLFPDAPIYTLLYDREKVGRVFPHARVVTSRLQNWPQFLRRRPKLLLPFLAEAVEAWDFSEYDIVISSASAFAQGIITNSDTRHICYCHSPARFLWDHAHEYQKENKIRGLKKVLLGAYLRYLREWNQLSAKRVDRFLANSQTVQKRIQKYYRADSDIVYPPVEIERIRMSARKENYFLIVSQLTPYKKIDLAISVFNKLRRRLVIVGEGPQKDYLRAIAGPTIELLGFQSDATVTELLANCRGFILPGEEDFGIAPIEAMAAGKAVLALGKGGAVETVVDVRQRQEKFSIFNFQFSNKSKIINSKIRNPQSAIRNLKLAPTGVLFSEPTAKGLEAGLAVFFEHEAKFQPAKIRAHAKKFSRQIFEERIKLVVKEEWGKAGKNKE